MAIEKEYILLPKNLNRDVRLLGYPLKEALVLGLSLFAAMHHSNITFLFWFIFIFLFGRIRAKHPKDWLPYLPYSEFKLVYPYLLPPGRKTLLP